MSANIVDLLKGAPTKLRRGQSDKFLYRKTIVLKYYIKYNYIL